MKTILHSFFGRAETAGSIQPAGAHTGHATPANADAAEISVRRQLVDKLLLKLLQRSGIPAGWVEPQMLVLSSRTRGNGAHLRLVLKHGDEQMLKYIFAVQKELQKDIFDADIHAVQWLQGISWQLDVDSSCLRTALPDKSFWQPVIEAQEANKLPKKAALAPPQTQLQAVRAAAQSQPQSAATGSPVKVACPASATPTQAASAAAQPLTAAALLALRQLREARTHVSLPATAARPQPAAQQILTGAAVNVKPAALPGTPVKPRAAPSFAKPRLDYGAPNFECSRPAEETELTPDLAALFALESQNKPQSVKS